jgi:hypothetical protein
VSDFERRHFGERTIGVHIRQTDNMSPRHLSMKGMFLSAFLPALDESTREAADAVIFVATDNRAVVDFLRQRYPRVVSRDKWYPAQPGEPMHGNRACPDKVRMAEDALVDLYLLAGCDGLIYSSKTSFARFARYLSRKPRQEAIDVASADKEPSGWLPRTIQRLRSVGWALRLAWSSR